VARLGRFSKLMTQLDDVLENVTPAQRESLLTKSLEGMIKRYETTPPRFATGDGPERAQGDPGPIRLSRESCHTPKSFGLLAAALTAGFLLTNATVLAVLLWLVQPIVAWWP
jgi:hypothetical protein